jgi:hypothetical protein
VQFVLTISGRGEPSGLAACSPRASFIESVGDHPPLAVCRNVTTATEQIRSVRKGKGEPCSPTLFESSRRVRNDMHLDVVRPGF